MNVFFCHQDPISAARLLEDRLVIKMTLETAQILSTVAHLRGASFQGRYRMTHARHPVVVKAAEDADYLEWVTAHGYGLAFEYRARFGRVHSSESVIDNAAGVLFDWQADCRQARPVFCGPEDCRRDTVVESYRAALRAKYATWATGKRPLKWTNTEPPEWAGVAK